MHPRIYQSLRVFTYVGGYLNLSEAARRLNMTKGAVSYQIKQLENSLGFDVFERTTHGLRFTEHGRTLYSTAQPQFDLIDQRIADLRDQHRQLTVGMTTYFASRWLAPRLMRFTSENPHLRLRIQPTEGLVDLESEGLDLAIQWGDGSWPGRSAELLFRCPAFATCGALIRDTSRVEALDVVMARFPLLHDFEGSRSWQRWFEEAGIPLPAVPDHLVIADPNVRVEAVIGDQGIALNDALVRNELESGRLFQLSAHRLSEYGYFLVFRNGAAISADAEAFHQWIVEEARNDDYQQGIPGLQ